MSSMNIIQELLMLDEIEKAEEQYKSVYSHAPFSLSTWNPSDYYRNVYLFNKTVLPQCPDIIDYIYSYELDAQLLKSCCLHLTGSENAPITITNSGTASITLVASVLSALKRKRILVISPTYFSVLYNCQQMGFELKELHMLRQQGGYRLPQEEILNALDEIDVLWVTNPIYNTGIYINEDDQEFLYSYVLPDKYLVADECFCQTGKEFSRRFSGQPHFIGIYDPMKQFLINGMKFSTIVHPAELQNIIEQWSDVVCGSLTNSTVQAMTYYISQESDSLRQSVQQANQMIQKQVRVTVSKFEQADLDDHVDGHMMMCYVPNLKADYLNTSTDFCAFQENTDASIIPGTRFHFPDSCGFSFRINLARFDPTRFSRALQRVLAHLSEEL